MEIAVLLASYNGSKRLPRLLDSILAQLTTTGGFMLMMMGLLMLLSTCWMILQ